MNRIILTALIGLFFSLSAVANNAFLDLKKSAETGDAGSQLAYALALYDLDSDEESRKWFEISANQGNAEAWFRLSYDFRDGTIANYEKAAELGYVDAYEIIFDELLFRAGSSGKGANLIKIKMFADIARERGYKIREWDDNGDSDLYNVIDTCYENCLLSIPIQDHPLYSQEGKYPSYGYECSIYLEGVGVEKNFSEYRKCLLSGENYIQSNGNRLAEVYANGWGVEKDIGLSIALSCHSSHVPAELESIIKRLTKISNNNEEGQIYRYCDHATSGLTVGACRSDMDWVEDEKRREKYPAGFNNIDGWTVDEKLVGPKCFVQEWWSSDNFKEYGRRYSIQRDRLTGSMGRLFGREIPDLQPITPSWADSSDDSKKISLIKTLRTCTDVNQDYEINDGWIYANYSDDEDRPDVYQYKIWRDLSAEQCSSLSPYIGAKCIEGFVVEVSTWGGGSIGDNISAGIYGLFDLPELGKSIVPLVITDNINGALNSLDKLK